MNDGERGVGSFKEYMEFNDSRGQLILWRSIRRSLSKAAGRSVTSGIETVRMEDTDTVVG